jgi:hypothetical protein
MALINCRLKKVKAAAVAVGACVIALVFDGFTALFSSEDYGGSQPQSLRRGLLVSGEQQIAWDAHQIDGRLRLKGELGRTGKRRRALDPDARAIAHEYFAVELKQLELERLHLERAAQLELERPQMERAARDGMTDPESSVIGVDGDAKAGSLRSERRMAKKVVQKLMIDHDANAVAVAGDARSERQMEENNAQAVMINPDVNAIVGADDTVESPARLEGEKAGRHRNERNMAERNAQEVGVLSEVDVIADVDDSNEAGRLDRTSEHDAKQVIINPEVNAITGADDAKRFYNRLKRAEARRLEMHRRRAEQKVL